MIAEQIASPPLLPLPQRISILGLLFTNKLYFSTPLTILSAAEAISTDWPTL